MILKLKLFLLSIVFSVIGYCVIDLFILDVSIFQYIGIELVIVLLFNLYIFASSIKTTDNDGTRRAEGSVDEQTEGLQ